MVELSSYSLKLLAQKHLSPVAYDFVVGQLEVVRLLLDNPIWWNSDIMSTDYQIGYLAGLIDLERDDKIEAVRILTGLDISTTKDIRLTRYICSVLINYYLNGDGHKFNEAIGYTSASAKRKAKRTEREAARAAKAARKHVCV
jgi:hypothetical protein